MSFSSFGKESGPKTPDEVHLTPLPQSRLDGSTVRWGDGKGPSFQDVGSTTYQRPVAVAPHIALGNPRDGTPANMVRFHHAKRTNQPYFPSPDEILKKSRGSFDPSLSNVISTEKDYMIPNQPRSPPKVFQKNMYIGGQQPRPVVSQQLQYSPSIWGTRLPSPTHGVLSQEVISPTSIAQPRPIFNPKPADVLSKQPNSAPSTIRETIFRSYGNTSPSRYLIDYRDLDAPHSEVSASVSSGNKSSLRKSTRPSGGNEGAFPSYPMHVREGLPFVSSEGNHHSERNIKDEDDSLLKGTTLPSAGVNFMQNSSVSLDQQRVYDRRSPGHRSVSPSPTSVQADDVDISAVKQSQFPNVRNSVTPYVASFDHDVQERSDYLEGTDRESDAKAKRLARFRDELSQPEQQKVTAKTRLAKQKFPGDPASNEIRDSAAVDVSSEYEGMVSTSSVIGSCPDMCPESERAERERKGDLDQYERVDGDRNLTSTLLAVKKYNRTAEREAELIRPMPILQITMEYLMNLLRKPYDHRFLGLYNFLWDRMRAIRMDLRMQHIFNLEAINMLEQMIRLHIIAMHELCEHMKGEGFSEGFDAHLNIEQMNKTSVELFQLYDDHRKKGIHVPSEKEFRGYYALLKLDKHPGYKVEPAELSLDLAKMTPEMRQTSEVLFARDVARACRASNFIAFFRLARRATYLQACLMHAHFAKLRIQALACLHSGLQINQGIPVAHVAEWLGMEEEDIGDILGFSGFSVKDFEEPYLVKENMYVDLDNEVPVRRSKLVERKRSSEIVRDVLYFSATEIAAPEGVKEMKLKTGPVTIPKVSSSAKAVMSTPIQDVEMLDFPTILSPNSSSKRPAVLSPKSSSKKPAYWTSTDLTTQDVEFAQDVPTSSSSLDIPGIFTLEPQRRDQHGQPEYNPIFWNSFGGAVLPEMEVKAPLRAENETKYSAVPFGSVGHTPPSSLTHIEVLEDAEQTINMEEEDTFDEEARRQDEEVAEAKLKLTLRTWKRHATKKREFREHKLLAANSALSLLSLGPPIWRFEEQPSNAGALDIDHAMKKRHEIQERSLSVLNPCDVIASELVEKNPESKCLSWKLVLCSPYASNGFPTDFQSKAKVPASCSWLKKKLLPENRDDERDLLVSSHGLAIRRSWICDKNDSDETCCMSIVRQYALESLDNASAGASAVLFLSAEDVPLEFRKKQLHDLIMSLPSCPSLPLLILSDSKAYDSDSSTIARDLELYEIKESRISKVHIAFLRDNRTEKMDGFFSDEYLREGLKWLARESRPQVVLREIRTRELVLSHLNSRTLKAIAEVDYHGVSPNDCISAFNEALNLSMEDVAAAARANPTGWPCPEIKLLDESSEEYRFASWFLPTIGWSSPSQIESVMRAIQSSKLPSLNDDFSWLSQGIHTFDDFESQKLSLESCIFHYLTETSKMIEVHLARNEVGILVQKFTRLELHDSKYYIIPEWPLIFRRLYNWRLINFSSSTSYILAQSFSFGQDSDSEVNAAVVSLASSSNVARPPLDELMGLIGRRFGVDHEAYDTPSTAPIAHDPPPGSWDEAIALVDEEGVDAQTINNVGDSVVRDSNSEIWMRKRNKEEGDRLNQVLEKCSIVQSRIDKLLSVYF